MRARSISLRLTLIVGVLGMTIYFFGPSQRVLKTRASSAIQHIVFIIKENHSFDSYFGLFPGANGTTTGRVKNQGVVTTIPLNSAPDQPINFCHEWPCAQKDYDNGSMDSFNVSDPKCAKAP